jgi:hypothetical protein
MPSVIRLVYMLRRKPGLSLEEFHRVWRDEHGPLVAFHQVRLGILRYTQSHRLDDPSTAGMRGARGMKPPLRRVAEVWWESEEALTAALASDADSEPPPRWPPMRLVSSTCRLRRCGSPTSTPRSIPGPSRWWPHRRARW